MLHPECVELAAQLEGKQSSAELFFRNGGINELRPGKAIQWHHDYKNDPFIADVPTGGVEFMHYFGGSTVANGCLRIIKDSHAHRGRPFEEDGSGKVLPTAFEQMLGEQRGAAGAAAAEAMAAGDMADARLPGEFNLELSPHQLVVRSSSFYHATWRNQTEHGRLMHHWLFRPRAEGAGNHRFTWGDYLTPAVQQHLTAEQQGLLSIDAVAAGGKGECSSFAVAENYLAERDRELGKVVWGTRTELPTWSPKL